MYLNTIKVIHEKPTANIILSGKKLKASPLNMPRMLTLPTSFQHSTRSLRAIRQEKRNKSKLLHPDIGRHLTYQT